MEDSIQKFSRLSHIANDFQLAAKTYAQIIGNPSLLLSLSLSRGIQTRLQMLTAVWVLLYD